MTLDDIEAITGSVGDIEYAVTVEHLKVDNQEVKGIQIEFGELNLKWFIHSHYGWQNSFIHTPDDDVDILPPNLASNSSPAPFWMVFDKNLNAKIMKALQGCGMSKKQAQQTISIISKSINDNGLMDKISIPSTDNRYASEKAICEEDVDYSDPVWFFVDGKYSAKAVSTRVIQLFNEQNHSIKTIKETKIIHIFHDGIYVNGEDEVERMIRDLLGHFANKQRVSEAKAHIKIMTLTLFASFNPGDFINMQNGVYKVRLKTFYDTEDGVYNDPEMMFTYKIPVYYDPDATCPAIEKFFGYVLPDRIQREQVYEEFAYTFAPGYPLQKVFMWLGDGGTGKGTANRILEAIVGREFVAGWSIEALEKNDQQCHYNLLDKKVNICGDLPDKKVPFAWLKSASGGDVIPVKALYNEAFNVVNTCKFFFVMNSLPEFDDFTEGLFRRIILTVFEVTIPEKDIDPHLIDKLTSQQELSGFFNLLMDSYDNLMERGEFIYNPSRREVESTLSELRGEDVRLFIAEKCVEGAGEKYDRKAMHIDYVEWRKSRMATPKGKIAFNAMVKKLGFNETRFASSWVWTGLGKLSSKPTQAQMNLNKMSEDLNPKDEEIKTD